MNKLLVLLVCCGLVLAVAAGPIRPSEREGMARAFQEGSSFFVDQQAAARPGGPRVSELRNKFEKSSDFRPSAAVSRPRVAPLKFPAPSNEAPSDGA